MLKLIFGCGYLGSRVAVKWREAGHDVVVVTRSKERAHLFEREGYGAIVADVTRLESLRGLPSAETVLYAVGYDRKVAAGPSIDDVYAGGVGNVLAALSAIDPSPTPSVQGSGTMKRFIYISTTGVYGPASGEWVDEATPPNPQREGGRASLAAEQMLAAARPIDARGVILRLAGIYGPGRIPFVEKLRAGESIPAPVHGYMNLIHVEDAAEVVVAAANIVGSLTNSVLTTQAGPRVYCVSDGQPVQRSDYYSEVARQLSVPPPRFATPDPNSPRAVRAESNRRICNVRMLTELCASLVYPDYRAGLAAILTG